MQIKTKLCFYPESKSELERLGLESPKEEYGESDFEFDLSEVTGINTPSKQDPERFVIFLKGTNGILIHHEYKMLLTLWRQLKAKKNERNPI